jgi:hypothetical protein
MQLSKERIQEFKDLLEKKKGGEVSWEEAEEGAYNLTSLVKLLYDCWVKDEHRKKRLEESPKGFHLEGIGYTCFICGNSVSDEETWYDKWGIKCLVCQKAVDKKIIPASCAKNEDSWYSKYDLESRFNIDRHALKRFIKEGILKPRIVPNSVGRPHTYLFLIKDNKDTLPPKKLTESRLVKETKDGKDWHRSEPWYRFMDPHEAARGYKIMDYLRLVSENLNT